MIKMKLTKGCLHFRKFTASWKNNFDILKSALFNVLFCVYKLFRGVIKMMKKHISILLDPSYIVVGKNKSRCFK